MDADARFLQREEGYLARRVACLRAGLDIAVVDLTKSLVECDSHPALQAVVLKVLDDLDKVCADKPPLVSPQPTGFQAQSLCKHCDKRTGSKTGLLCRECKKALRSSM